MKLTSAEIEILLNNESMFSDSGDYADGAQHARELVAEGFDAGRALALSVPCDDEWSRGYIETLKELAK